MKKIKRLEYQSIKCPDLRIAQEAMEFLRAEFKDTERNIHTLCIINELNNNEDVGNYYIKILTNIYQLQRMKKFLKKIYFSYDWD